MAKEKKFTLREDYRPLLVKIKKLFPTMLEHVEIDRILLLGMRTKKSKFIAEIRRNGPPWSTILPKYCYCITFWEDRFDNKPKSYRLYVVLHELMHIHVNGFKAKEKGYRKLIRHDVQEFYVLVRKYGLRMENVKDVFKGEAHLLKAHAPDLKGEVIK